MDEDSPPRRYVSAESEEECFLHYVYPRRDDAEEMMLPKKASIILISPQILNDVPLLGNLMPNIASLTFEDFNTLLHFGLEISNCMTNNQDGPNQT